ncbi:MAG: PQQ-binding-like beta-propeller repeat protein [Pirellulaceae bacterium]|jgi:outer membrane protein assembly factor BamB|nr:PQQ-binding-like beta-propeller repeat protein [Pirellulaceae bacterium]MDP7016281.1 PQQ-binding-like beta-propeller repeat protein [Pirellulaceae bacterium]
MRQVTILLALVFLCTTTQAEDWPQFRGPNCNGLSTSKSLPSQFSLKENLLWRAQLKDGIGCPVVASGRVFSNAMTGPQTVTLFCHDAKTGDELWRRDLATGALPEIHKTNSQAATTPAADGDRVYFYFSTLGLYAFDAKTGEQEWRVKLPTPYFVFKWGPGMSPVLHGDKVIFCQDDDLHPAIYAFDRKTGDQIWKVDRTDMAVNYSHPVVCRAKNGKDELVVGGTGKLVGYDPDSGKQLWQARVLLRNIKTTPVSQDGVIYISLQSGGIANQWLATADQADTGDSDGRLTKAEMQAFVGDVKIPAAFFARFDRGDVNKDGYLEGQELDNAFLSPENFAGARWDEEDPSDQYIIAVRAGGRGDVTKTHVLWKRETRAPDHIVSPLVVENRMFVVKGGGIASCFNTETGEPIWDQKRIRNVGEYFASPIYGDGKIYVVGENGNVIVMDSGPQLKVLSKSDLGDSCLATPAIADGRIYFRTRSSLLCFADK